MDVQIKKCSHCGGEGVLKGRKKMKVVCKCCGAQGPVKPFASQAVEAWNRSDEQEQTNG